MSALPGPSMRDEEVPLPPEPPDEEWFREYDFEQDAADADALTAEELAEPDPAAEFVLVTSDAEITAERYARWERARRVHARPTMPARLSDLLAAGPDPMGRHVGCDGDEDGARGCGVAPWVACRTPGGRFVPGFVHPSRLVREYELFDLPVPTVTV